MADLAELNGMVKRMQGDRWEGKALIGLTGRHTLSGPWPAKPRLTARGRPRQLINRLLDYFYSHSQHCIPPLVFAWETRLKSVRWCDNWTAVQFDWFDWFELIWLDWFGWILIEWLICLVDKSDIFQCYAGHTRSTKEYLKQKGC